MKLAFFVEGYTEVLLIKELALFNYGENDLSYVLYRLRGGNTIPVRIIRDEFYNAKAGVPKYTFHIYDCGGLYSLRSMINHQRNSLYNSGFNKIIGIRDVHPDERAQIPRLRMQFRSRMAQKPIPTAFLLCVMETEAWFIADYQHFLTISNDLTTEFIEINTGFDLKTLDVESLDTPAETLNEIYNCAGESYEKSIDSIGRTVNSLDLFSLYCILPDNIPSLMELISEIDDSK